MSGGVPVTIAELSDQVQAAQEQLSSLNGLVDTLIEENDKLLKERRKDKQLIAALESAIVMQHDVIAQKDRNLQTLVQR